MRWVVPLALAWGVSANALTWRADLPAAGDDAHLWLAAPAAALPGEEPGPVIELLHADGRDDEPAWERVTRLRGRVAAMAAPHTRAGEPGGSAGKQGTGPSDHLWLVFDGGAVIRVSLAPGPLDDQWFFSTRPVANLPAGLDVVAAAAAGDALWVLGQTRDAAVVARFDAVEGADSAMPADIAVHEAELLNLILGLPRPLAVESGELAPSALALPDGVPVVSGADSDGAVPDPAGSVVPSPLARPIPEQPIRSGVETDTPIQLLLVYRKGSWQRVPIPELGPTQAIASLVAPAPGSEDGRPTRIAYSRTGDKGVIVATQPVANGGWEQVTLDAVGPGLVRGLRVDGQLVVVRQIGLAPGVVQAAVVRGTTLTPLGDLAIEPADSGDATAAVWAAVPLDGGVGVVSGPSRAATAVASHLAGRSADAPPELALGVIDLRGRVSRAPAALGLEPARPFADAADYLLMLAAVVGATLLLFSFWRRDPRLNQPRLPKSQVVADLWRRTAGGVVDLTISGAVISGAMGLSAEDLMARWPGRGRGDTLEFILPGLLLIGLTVLHTTVSELLTARSAGKAIARTRLTNLDGGPPSTGQVLVRGLLKPFDLIAYLLMVLPVVNPGHQRLADLIARTLVVRNATDSDAESDAGSDTASDTDSGGRSDG